MNSVQKLVNSLTFYKVFKIVKSVPKSTCISKILINDLEFFGRRLKDLKGDEFSRTGDRICRVGKANHMAAAQTHLIQADLRKFFISRLFFYV